jgi:hypothetical protein
MSKLESVSSHDTHLFSRMVDILVMSGTGNFNYGLDISNLGILASVLNENGETNKWGKSINANQLKQVIYRIRSKGLLDEFSVDWSEFSHPSSIGHAYKNIVHMKSDLTRTIPRQWNQVGNLQPNTL